MPVWAYVVNIIFLIIVSFLGLASLSSDLPTVGSLSIEGDKIIINQNGRIFRLMKKDVVRFSLTQDFMKGRHTGLRVYSIRIETIKGTHEFEIKASSEAAGYLEEVL